jgi:hypothetical protein
MVHDVRPRFARWILTKQDRARTNTFPFPLELIADMLTIPQTSAGALLDQLTQEGLINYQNDVVQIPNRSGLHAIVCECYERVQIEMNKIRVKREMREP